MQENTKSVVVKMTARRCFRTEPIWQYDGGHVLTFEGFELPAAFEVHFSRSPMGKAIPQIGTDGVCTVPEMFTQDAGVIYAWLYIADTDSRLTKYSIEIPVTKRAKPTNQEPTPVEQSAIDQAIAALNAGVERSETAADAAESAQEAAEGYAESAGNSAITATNAANSAASAKTAAETAARNAATSATDAHTSREAADQSATNAGVSERAAASSASAAAGSATSAAASAGQASASATAASGSASTASTKASEAAQSATAAAGSAASASEDAGTSSTAATAAEASATAAAGSATAAAGSAASAGQSATAAAGSASDAAEIKDYLDENYGEISDDVNSLKSAVTDLDDGKIYINPNKGTWYKGYFDSTGAFIADQGNAAPENTPILFKAGDVLNIKPNEMNVQIRTYTYSGGVYTQISNTVYTTNQVIKFTDDIYVSIHANKTGVVTITTADITCDIYKDSETKKYIDSQVSDVEDRVDEQISDIEDHVDEQIDLLAPTIEEQITQTIAHTDFTSFGNKTVSADGDFYDNDSYYSYIYQFDKAGKFYVNNFGNSSYGFIATYSGYPSKSTFITRNYNGTTPSEMGKIDVTAGQYVFVSVNLLSTIVFNTYLDYTANTQPTLFRREMKIAWFGDSISQLQLLPHRVGNNIGCTVYDCSFAGSALTFGSTRYGGMSVYSLSGQIASGNFTDLETSLDNQEADNIDVTQKRINAATLEGLNFDTDVSHVVIMGGTNDLNNDYVTTSSDLTAFKGAVQDIIDNFNTSFPHIRLAFISDPYRGDITPTNPDKYGHSLIDINEAIQEVCEANNIVFYDLYHCSGINANTVGYYLMNDQLHQTEAGDILLAEKCAKWLEAN